MSSKLDSARSRHWERTRNLTYVILALWVLFGIILPYYADALNAWNFLSFPLGYWFCVQGSLLAFLAMIVYQNWKQDKIDADFEAESGREIEG